MSLSWYSTLKSFLGKFCLKNGSSPNRLKFGAGVHCYMLITILLFIFSKCSSFILFWANFVPKCEILQINWNLVQGYIAIGLLRFLCFFFQNFCHSYFLGQIWSQNLKFSVLTEIWGKRTFLYACYNFNVYFSQIFVTHIFWTNLVP